MVAQIDPRVQDAVKRDVPFMRFVMGGIMKRASKLLEGDETIIRADVPETGLTAAGLLLVTDRRVLYVSESPARNAEESFPYAEIKNVRRSDTTAGKVDIEIETTSGARRNFKGFFKDGDGVLKEIQVRMTHVVHGEAEESLGLGGELTKLAQLRSQGALTEEEFARAKEKLLAD